MLLGYDYLGVVIYPFCSGRKLSSSQVMFMDSSCGCTGFGSFEGMRLRLEILRQRSSRKGSSDSYTKVKGDPSMLFAPM